MITRGPVFHHIPELTGIRAIAVILVMASHAGLYGKVPGGLGVTIFFFLSGYLITTLLRIEFTNTATVDCSAFYLRRTLRIMPPLYITLILLTALYALGVFGGGLNWAAVPWDYLFLANYSELWGQGSGLPSPLWSLAIEEHFYLLFPVVFISLMKKRSATSIAGVFALGCLLVLSFRFATFWFFPALVADNYIWTHTRLDSILFGSILALYQNPLFDVDAWRPKRWQAAAACLLIISTFAIRNELFRQTIRYSIQGVALFVLFSFVLWRKSPILSRILSSTPLVWIGLLSYTLYLCHMAINLALTTEFGLTPMLAGILGFPLALLYAQLMRSFVEVPILASRRRHRAATKSLPLAGATAP